MTNRTRDVVNMARGAGLEVISQYQRAARIFIEAKAPNGVVTTFGLPLKPGDRCGDLNEQARMRRFARENPAPTPEATQSPAEAAACAPATPITVKRKTLTNSTPKQIPTAAETPAARELTMTEFYRLCEWIKTAITLDIPNLAALALDATSFIGHPVSEAALQEAINATGTPTPEHWNPLPPAELVVVREIALLLKALGAKPSSDFTRLAASMGVV